MQAIPARQAETANRKKDKMKVEAAKLDKITLYVYPDSFKDEKHGTFIKSTLSGGFLDMFFADTGARQAVFEYKAIADNGYYMGTSGVLDGRVDLLSPYYRNKYNAAQAYLDGIREGKKLIASA